MGQRYKVRSSTPYQSCPDRIGGQLLLQMQAAGQPMNQGVIEVQGLADSSDAAGQVIGAANVSQFVGDNGASLGVGPGAPIRRQEQQRPLPSQGRRGGQFRGLAHGHAVRISHECLKLPQHCRETRIIDWDTAPAQTDDGPHSNRQPQASETRPK
jgi:hypothetical protein